MAIGGQDAAWAELDLDDVRAVGGPLFHVGDDLAEMTEPVEEHGPLARPSARQKNGCYKGTVLHDRPLPAGPARDRCELAIARQCLFQLRAQAGCHPLQVVDLLQGPLDFRMLNVLLRIPYEVLQHRQRDLRVGNVLSPGLHAFEIHLERRQLGPQIGQPLQSVPGE